MSVFTHETPMSLSPLQLHKRTMDYVRATMPYLLTDVKTARDAYRRARLNTLNREPEKSLEYQKLMEAEKALAQALKDAKAVVSQESFTQEEMDSLKAEFHQSRMSDGP